MGAKRQESSFPECPRCTSQDIWRNGVNRAGNQQFRCKTCGRVFVLEPYLPDWVKLVARRMMVEEIPVPTIASVLKGYVSRRWLYDRKGELHVQ